MQTAADRVAVNAHTIKSAKDAATSITENFLYLSGRRKDHEKTVIAMNNLMANYIGALQVEGALTTKDTDHARLLSNAAGEVSKAIEAYRAAIDDLSDVVSFLIHD